MGVTMEVKDICKKCGGDCCKRYPGITDPKDFKDEKSMREAIASGLFCMDMWEGEFEGTYNVLYIRPSIKEHEGDILDRSWGGPCTFLTGAGCLLSHDSRPRQCRELEPTGQGCKQHHKKESAVRTWVPHQRILKKIEGELR